MDPERRSGGGKHGGPISRALHRLAESAVRQNAFRHLFLAAILSGVTYLAVENFFIQDDGFITLRYVDHFLRGHGPVWYPGSDEFGYTNFLFMLLVTLVSSTGLDPVVSASVVSYAGFYLSLIAAYLIVYRMTAGSVVAAGLSVAVIFSNFNVSSYASGLLDASLQLAFVLLTFLSILHYALRPHRIKYLYLASTAASLAMLTRLDSIVLIAPVYLFLFFRVWTADEGPRRLLARHTAFSLLIPAIVLAAFFSFCLAFYGTVLPNSFHAKADMNITIGLIYILFFALGASLIYIWLPLIIVIHRFRTRWQPPLVEEPGGFGGALTAAALLWTAYVCYVGGGFMGFRLMIPFIAIFFIRSFATMATRFGIRFLVPMAIAAMVTQIGPYVWNSDPAAANTAIVDTPARLDRNLTRPQANWQIFGRRLNALFFTGDPADVKIAVGAAGAIPYYARLPAFDIHGLNTREVAIHGEIVGVRAGHRKQATLHQMRRAGVHLIVDNLTYLCDRIGRAVGYDELPPTPWQAGLPAILIPLPTDGCWMVAYYLDDHPDIDALIARGEVIQIEAD